jgi:hypothetical protein
MHFLNNVIAAGLFLQPATFFIFTRFFCWENVTAHGIVPWVRRQNGAYFRQQVQGLTGMNTELERYRCEPSPGAPSPCSAVPWAALPACLLAAALPAAALCFLCCAVLCFVCVLISSLCLPLHHHNIHVQPTSLQH